MAWYMALDQANYEVVYGNTFNITGRIYNDHGGSVAGQTIYVGKPVVDSSTYITVTTDANGAFSANVVTAGWAQGIFDPAQFPPWNFTPNCTSGSPSGQFYTIKTAGNFFEVEFCDPNPNVFTGRCARIDLTSNIKVWMSPCSINNSCPPPQGNFAFTANAALNQSEYRNEINYTVAFSRTAYGAQVNGCYPRIIGMGGANATVVITVRRPDNKTDTITVVGNATGHYRIPTGTGDVPLTGNYIFTFRYAGDAANGLPAQTDAHTVTVTAAPTCTSGDVKTQTCQYGDPVVLATCGERGWVYVDPVPTCPDAPVDPIDPTIICTEGDVSDPYPCSSNGARVIYRKTCVNNAWVASGQTCPVEPPPTVCSEGQYTGTPTACSDGVTYLYPQVCHGGDWVPNTQQCPPPSEGNCVEGAYSGTPVQCADGSWVYPYLCQNGTLVPNAQQCAATNKSNIMPYLMLGGIGLLITGFVLAAKKKEYPPL